MSLDIYLERLKPTVVYQANITHNLNKMAAEAGIYEALWHPEVCGIHTALQLHDAIKAGVEDMRERPDYYRQFDASNGWGTYDAFVTWLDRLLEACNAEPEATVRVWI